MFVYWFLRTWQTKFFNISAEQIKCMKKFWSEIYSESCRLFEHFYRFQFTFLYHEKSIFSCKSTSSVALIFRHILSYFAVLISHLKVASARAVILLTSWKPLKFRLLSKKFFSASRCTGPCWDARGTSGIFTLGGRILRQLYHTFSNPLGTLWLSKSMIQEFSFDAVWHNFNLIISKFTDQHITWCLVCDNFYCSSRGDHLKMMKFSDP